MKPVEFETVVYRDERYMLGSAAQGPVLIAAGKRYALSCHPYEPCLYITNENGSAAAVRNAFDPSQVLECFQLGQTVRSVTGFVYDAAAFCRMVEYAADKGEQTISDAERVFGDRSKQRPVPQPPAGRAEVSFFVPAAGCDESDYLPGDPFYALIARYPDLVLDYCLVKNSAPYSGAASHERALDLAARRLLTADGEEPWRYDLAQAHSRTVPPEAFFSAEGADGRLTYPTAFLSPPYPHGYTEEDYQKVNAVLFPNGTAELAVREWTTDWSDYFDDGHEWWGALCVTVYDKSMDRFVVIMASATD